MTPLNSPQERPEGGQEFANRIFGSPTPENTYPHSRLNTASASDLRRSMGTGRVRAALDGFRRWRRDHPSWWIAWGLFALFQSPYVIYLIRELSR